MTGEVLCFVGGHDVESFHEIGHVAQLEHFVIILKDIFRERERTYVDNFYCRVRESEQSRDLTILFL